MSRFIIILYLFVTCIALEAGQVDLTGYLLPNTHPTVEKLQKIFNDSSLLESRSRLVNAGFVPTEHQGANSVTLKHPSLKGYIVKLLTDTFPVENEAERFVLRIDGERAARKCVRKYRWEDFFKIPRQWIYVLPHPSERRRTVLIAEDADIVPHHQTERWYRDKITKSALKKIYRLTTEVGLQDCCRKTNLPRTKDGRLAIVDTETFHVWPVEYDRLLVSLNSKMQNAWLKIIKENGK